MPAKTSDGIDTKGFVRTLDRVAVGQIELVCLAAVDAWRAGFPRKQGWLQFPVALFLGVTRSHAVGPSGLVLRHES